MKTYVFFEGATEKHVCDRIARIMPELAPRLAHHKEQLTTFLTKYWN